MPYYDINRSLTSNASPLTESTHFWAKTVPNQEVCYIKLVYVSARLTTAGGASLRVKSNVGSTALGGTAQTPIAKNMRIGAALPAASSWNSDNSAITNGGTLTPRLTVGFAQTGGTGGWVPVEAGDAFAMMPNAINQVDVEFTSLTVTPLVPFDLTIEISEGM
jgi:hypothetical protein